MENIESDKIIKNVTEIILESISDGVFTVDNNWKIMSFNRAAEEITGISRDEAIGKYCWNVFRSNMCEGECALKKTMKEGKSFISTSTYIINSEQKQIPITVSTSPLKDEKGKILGCVETFRDHSLVEELRKEIAANYQIGDIISRSSAMARLFKVLPKIAESESTVLIEGETGTGKELTARAIHNLSYRADKPFIAINCGAFPDSLLESELFGFKAGAFTNAVKDKAGYFAIAEGGTILLDEIGDTSSAFQVKLLRVLEAHEFQPLGSEKKQKTNIRIIAATNKNLSLMVKNKEFRIDLFYRINVINLKLPPLRNRMEDIPLLINHFINKLNRIRGKFVNGVDHEVLEILMSYNFPGNIRELENIIEHAFILCSDGDIMLSHIPEHFSSMQPLNKLKYNTSNDPVKAAEIKMITDTLQKNNFNRKDTARDLGIHKSTLFRKMNKLGIALPKIDGRSKNIQKNYNT